MEGASSSALQRAAIERLQQLKDFQGVDAVDISAQAASIKHRREGRMLEAPMNLLHSVRTQILSLVVEAFTGTGMSILDPGELSGNGTFGEVLADQLVQAGLVVRPDQRAENGQGTPQAPQPPAWGIEYDVYEFHRESEKTTFEAEGVVKTADGKEISIDIALSMSREFVSETRTQFRAGEVLKDPLVINFAGNAAELTETKFAFDLDVDGHADQISFLKPGSGFLALDGNGNGEIDDGAELFGPQSGNGFQDLAAYDSDANGFIDEADPVFERLRIWQPSENGHQLMGLGAKGVGAIWLGHLDTPFELKDSSNQQQGQIASTGVYLGEDGSAGSVQHVDMVT